MERLERAFEGFLWGTRWLVLLAVAGSLAASLAMFVVSSVDAVQAVAHLRPYLGGDLSEASRAALRATTVRHVVEIVDGYLLAAVLLMFALGLYEIFISKIGAAEGTEQAENVLVVRTLDDLKSRLAKVILLILVVSFFERVMTMRVERPVELLYVAGGIALIGLALWLAHAAEGGAPHRPGPDPR
jgi:uncharacterized membrane protein YqhA